MVCDKDPGVAEYYHRKIGLSLARMIEIRGMFTAKAVKEAIAMRIEYLALYMPTMSRSEVVQRRLTERQRDKEKAQRQKEGLGEGDSPIKKRRRRNEVDRLCELAL
jgi:hypothetical protein